jgi:hypothetical protein
LVLGQAVDIGLGQDLIEVLVARAPGRIAAAALFFARMANFTLAAAKILANAVATRWLRASKDDMQPTQ